MKKKLKIEKLDNKLIIKKKIDLWSCLILAFVVTAMIAFCCIFAPRFDNKAVIIILTVLLFMGNASYFASLMLGKIVVDTDKREFTVSVLRRETHSFNEVKDIYIKADRSDAEGPARFYVVVYYKNAHSTKFEATSQAQANELTSLLKEQILGEEDRIK